MRKYKVWGSFNRNTGHDFYIVSKAGAIVSHRNVARRLIIRECSASIFRWSLGQPFDSFLIQATGVLTHEAAARAGWCIWHCGRLIDEERSEALVNCFDVKLEIAPTFITRNPPKWLELWWILVRDIKIRNSNVWNTISERSGRLC